MLDQLYEYFIDYGTATEERRHLSTLNRACLQPIKDKLTETEYFDLDNRIGNYTSAVDRSAFFRGFRIAVSLLTEK